MSVVVPGSGPRRADVRRGSVVGTCEAEPLRARPTWFLIRSGRYVPVAYVVWSGSSVVRTRRATSVRPGRRGPLLAVAAHVDAAVDLDADDTVDRSAQSTLELLGIGFAAFALVDEQRTQLRAPRQAPGMCRQDAPFAALHALVPPRQDWPNVSTGVKCSGPSAGALPTSPVSVVPLRNVGYVALRTPRLRANCDRVTAITSAPP
jgi:hypothetical protein